MKNFYYVNWDKREILTQDEYNAKIDERAKVLYSDMYDFENWLNTAYNAFDMWDTDEDKREDVRKEWRAICADEALWEFQNEYDEVIK